MIDDYGSKVPGDRECEAQILRIMQYMANVLPDLVWQDRGAADVVIEAFNALLEENARLAASELGYAGL